MYDDFLIRRAEFVLKEALMGVRIRDQAITMTLRVLSNHFTVGKDGCSASVKKLNPWQSEKAQHLKKILPHKEFHNSTLNEHQMPLQWVWEEILLSLSLGNFMSAHQLCDLIKKYPYVTITKNEDDALRKNSKKAKGPEERYALAGIRVTRIS
jgi:hypothetical protein